MGAGLLVSQRLPPALAVGEEPGRNESGPLIARVTRPLDAETPVREFKSFLTPNHRFFVRSHFGPPAAWSSVLSHQDIADINAWLMSK